METAVQPWMQGRVAASGPDEIGRPAVDQMRVGLSEVFWPERGRDRTFIMSAATLIERLGYDSIWLPEHVVRFESVKSKHPYAGTRHQTGWEHQNKGFVDGPIVAVLVAATTQNLRIGTYVTILGERNPVLFAHEIATVDHLTNGRFTLGVGVGWSREEYSALGVPFERRGARVDDYMRAMNELWTKDVSEYHGEFVDFGPLYAYPKPFQSPRTPMVVAGQSLRGIDRAAELGDGLIVYNLEPDKVALCVEEYARALKKHGRSVADARVIAGRRNVAGDAFTLGEELSETRLHQVWEADAEFVEACRRLGTVSEVVLSPRLPNSNYCGLMTEYANTLGLTPRG